LKGKTKTEKKIRQKRKKTSWAAAHWPPVQRASCAAFQPAPLEAGHRSSLAKALSFPTKGGTKVGWQFLYNTRCGPMYGAMYPFSLYIIQWA
jgi:hypothetical protein